MEDDSDFALACHRKLREEIFSRSVENSDWKKACSEWKLDRVEKVEDGECICSHQIVYEHWIKNSLNSNTVQVGSTCIMQFEGNDTLKNESAQAEDDVKRKEKGLKVIRECTVCGRRTKKLIDGSYIHIKCRREEERKNAWNQRQEEWKKKGESWKKNTDDMNGLLEQIMPHMRYLTSYERDFVESMSKNNREKGASDKQIAWLRRLAKKTDDLFMDDDE